METCKWERDSTYFTMQVWITDCENAFTLESGTPVENEMKFCCYCGRPLEQIEAEEERDEEWIFSELTDTD